MPNTKYFLMHAKCTNFYPVRENVKRFSQQSLNCILKMWYALHLSSPQVCSNYLIN